MSNFWKIFISIVATAGIIGGGIFYIMQKQIDKIQSDNLAKSEELSKQIATLKTSTSTATTTPVTTTTPATTDETANWKTYTNSTYSFSFKYPATFTLTDTLSPDSSKDVDNKIVVKKGTEFMELYINPDGFGPFFPDYDYKLTYSGGKISYTSTKGTDENRIDQSTLAMSNQLTVSSNKYLFFYKIGGTDTRPLDQFDTILSTFQFTK